MTDMIEKVKKAIDDEWDTFVKDRGSGDPSERFARAAIEALRVPSEEMLAAQDATGSLESVWPAMIEAALGEQEE